MGLGLGWLRALAECYSYGYSQGWGTAGFRVTVIVTFPLTLIVTLTLTVTVTVKGSVTVTVSSQGWVDYVDYTLQLHSAAHRIHRISC